MDSDSSMAYPARYSVADWPPRVRRMKKPKASAAAIQRMVAAIEVERTLAGPC